MYHVSKAVSAFGEEDNDTVFQKTMAVNDFYLPGDGREWPLATSRCSASPTPGR